jgi:dihydropteroate synthase-like protein
MSVSNLKVLLITGSLAKDTVKHFTRESHVKTKILALKVPVAALLTLEQIAKSLENLKCNDFDVILVPGLIRGDATIITDTVGTTTFKGPRYAADLPTVLNALRKTELSTVTPACDILREELQKKALRELDVVEENRELLLKNPNNVLIGELPVGRDFPMRVMAEIVDAPLLPKEEIQRLAINYVRLGADIIDVGMIAGESNPLEARRAVEVVKRIVNVPISIDTLDPDEIKEAVSVGADMILSADAGNIEMIAPFASDTAVVVIPTNQREGHFFQKAEERVIFLEQIIKKAKTLGITKCVGDLILDPANALESLIAFREFGDRNPSIPLFLGVSNITELIDADSVGVNALLARLAAEIGVSILLATEKSDKAKGSVREEVIAAKMMFLAKKRGSVPKDLGIDLLMLKDKKIREEPYREEVEAKTRVTIAAGKPEATILDANGLFKIAVDRKEENIVALHFATPQDDKPLNIIKGKTAEHIYAKIVEMSLITRLDHAAYLGNELSKAEIALTTGKEYIQDRPLFKKLLSF